MNYPSKPDSREQNRGGFSGNLRLGADYFIDENNIRWIIDYKTGNPDKKHQQQLLKYATKELLKIDGVKIYGTSSNKTAVISFNIDKIHPYDIGTIIDKLGVEVRTGQHCTQPIMDFYKISGTIRASFAFYNTKEEIDILIEKVEQFFEFVMSKK